ncbi:MAG TPA: hypothetical protein VN649_06645 [Ramlibacter sp.]|nr:hypothetical protein [Ramlibacter sp.]
MFDRIKKAFSSKLPQEAGASVAPNSQLAQGPVSEWAATQGFGFSVDGSGQAINLEGDVNGKPWRIQLGSPSRAYIRGEEVRARAELGIDGDVAVLVMNRPLKEALEKQAYQIYTDSVQTSADPRLPEEMRWLAMYDEVGWDALPRAFWDRYGVLTDQKENAVAWIDPALAHLMLDWPEAATGAQVPFMMMLLRGKAYLRMEYTPAELATLQHAALIFTSACDAAMDGLTRDLTATGV